MNENKPTIDYAALLVDLEAKKQALDDLIVSVKVAAATGAVALGDLSIDSFAGVGLPTTQGTGSSTGKTYTIDDIPAGAFHGKSIPAAARAYLEMVKTNQTTKEIAKALLKGGIVSTSSNFESMIHVGLNRVRRKNGQFARVSGKWALPEWVPPSMRNAGPQPSKPKKKKKTNKAKKKAKKSKNTSGKAAKPQAKKSSTGVRDRIEAYIAQHPDTEYGAAEIAEAVGTKSNIAAMLLGKLAEMNRLKKTKSGKYVSPMVH